MIKKEDLIQIIQAAFSPLECVAELKNYGHGIGFCVYLPDIDNVIFEENNAENLTNLNQLVFIIEDVRSKIQAKDIVLDNWSLTLLPKV